MCKCIWWWLNVVVYVNNAHTWRMASTWTGFTRLIPASCSTPSQHTTPDNETAHSTLMSDTQILSDFQKIPKTNWPTNRRPNLNANCNFLKRLLSCKSTTDSQPLSHWRLWLVSPPPKWPILFQVGRKTIHSLTAFGFSTTHNLVSDITQFSSAVKRQFGHCCCYTSTVPTTTTSSSLTVRTSRRYNNMKLSADQVTK